MKFYYNGVLVRTSNHVYTHAVIRTEGDNITCMGCSSSKDGAEKIIRKEVSRIENSIQNEKRAMQARIDGKDGYYWRRGREVAYVRFQTCKSIEDYEDRIDYLGGLVAQVEENWKVVELESR